MTRDEYYAALNKTTKDITHVEVASEWSNHKYVDKKVVNGKTIYIYPEDKTSGNESNSSDNNREPDDPITGMDIKEAKPVKKSKEAKDKKSSKKSSDLDTMVNDVIRGKYGNGEARKKALGDKYAEVQKAVNEKLGKGTATTKSTADSKTKAKKKVLKGKAVAHTVKKTKLKSFKKDYVVGGHAKVDLLINHRSKHHTNTVTIE